MRNNDNRNGGKNDHDDRRLHGIGVDPRLRLLLGIVAMKRKCGDRILEVIRVSYLQSCDSDPETTPVRNATTPSRRDANQSHRISGMNPPPRPPRGILLCGQKKRPHDHDRNNYTASPWWYLASAPRLERVAHRNELRLSRSPDHPWPTLTRSALRAKEQFAVRYTFMKSSASKASRSVTPL